MNKKIFKIIRENGLYDFVDPLIPEKDEVIYVIVFALRIIALLLFPISFPVIAMEKARRRIIRNKKFYE